MWSSVTARLRNSYSSHLLTPGVTTRKPLLANSNIPRVVLLPGAHFSISLNHGTGVYQHHHCRGMQSVVHYDHYNYRVIPLLCQGSLFLQVMVPVRASSELQLFFAIGQSHSLMAKSSSKRFISSSSVHFFSFPTQIS